MSQPHANDRQGASRRYRRRTNNANSSRTALTRPPERQGASRRYRRRTNNANSSRTALTCPPERQGASRRYRRRTNNDDSSRTTLTRPPERQGASRRYRRRTNNDDSSRTTLTRPPERQGASRRYRRRTNNANSSRTTLTCPPERQGASRRYRRRTNNANSSRTTLTCPPERQGASRRYRRRTNNDDSSRTTLTCPPERQGASRRYRRRTNNANSSRTTLTRPPERQGASRRYRRRTNNANSSRTTLTRPPERQGASRRYRRRTNNDDSSRTALTCPPERQGASRRYRRRTNNANSSRTTLTRPPERQGASRRYRATLNHALLLLTLGLLFAARATAQPTAENTPYTIPLVDLADQHHRQVIVDREKGQYLGHPTTVLLEDNRTMLCVYPKGHGRGAIVMKRSNDAGVTWSDRLTVPENWATSKETPTIHRVIDADGVKRLIVWSGLYPARLAVSEDDGQTWTALKAAGDWGGIVVMSSVVALRDPGHYLALFHDDGRFFREGGQRGEFTLYKTFSSDGGLTWNAPETILAGKDVHLCEPGVIQSPDGQQMAVLLRENARRKNSHVIFSNDEGKTWTAPRELPAALTGDRHVGKYDSQGRLFISFRDTTPGSPTIGDWVGWVGTYDDIASGREGQYRVRLMQNHKDRDCAYPGVEVLPDDTFVVTTYGHWTAGEQPYIVSVRFRLAELDEMVR